MRIVVLARFFWPDLGGAQSQLRMLAEAWARQGHDVTVLTGRWENAWSPDERIAGYRIIRWPVTRTRVLGTVRFLAQIRQWLVRHQSDYDVVMVSMLKHAAWMAVRAGHTVGKPIFLKSWGAGASGEMAWQESDRFGRWVRQRTVDATGVFAPSPTVAEELERAGYRRIHLVPNGVPVPSAFWRAEGLRAARRPLGWPEATTLVTTGRLSPEKGLADLVRAMPAILARRPDVRLVMVGEGPERARLTQMVQELGLGNRVSMPGAVEDVTDSLRAGDLYVLPSHFEGLSVALLEALMMGMPATASDTPANQGILPDEDLPLFRTRDSESIARVILSCLDRPALSERAREELRGEVERRFGIDPVAAMHIDHFKRAIRSP